MSRAISPTRTRTGNAHGRPFRSYESYEKPYQRLFQAIRRRLDYAPADYGSIQLAIRFDRDLTLDVIRFAWFKRFRIESNWLDGDFIAVFGAALYGIDRSVSLDFASAWSIDYLPHSLREDVIQEFARCGAFIHGDEFTESDISSVVDYIDWMKKKIELVPNLDADICFAAVGHCALRGRCLGVDNTVVRLSDAWLGEYITAVRNWCAAQSQRS